MKVGTRSVLYGAHAFWLHPWFVAWAWWRLYGFPWDPRLWVAFFVHDLGYWGSPNMDGPEGARHPEVAARWMARWFDEQPEEGRTFSADVPILRDTVPGRWGCLVLYHSRFYAKKYGSSPSRLCFADKLALSLTPSWLYVPMAVLTGEIREYTTLASTVRPDRRGEDRRLQEIEADLPDRGIPWPAYFRWHRELRSYIARWVDVHKDGSEDTWTPDDGVREAASDSGVWR